MGRFAISFLYILIILSVSLKYGIALIPTALQQERLLANNKEKTEKAESSEEEKSAKEDFKKIEFLNNTHQYFIEKLTNELTYGDKDTRLPSIFQKIPKLPPKAFYS